MRGMKLNTSEKKGDILLKIALAAGSMPYFSSEGEKIYKKASRDMEKLSKTMGFDLTVYPDLIMTEKKAAEVRKEIDSKSTDFLLIFHPTYISGDIIFELFKTRADLGLWAAYEPTKEGPLPLASFVCLNQNTSIAGHFFKDNKKKFKWFMGEAGERDFRERFEVTVRVLNTVKELKELRIAQLGPIAEGFRNMYYDERDLYRSLGVDVIRDLGTEDVIRASEEIDKDEVRIEYDRVMGSFARVTAPEDKIMDSVRYYLSLRNICRDRNIQAVAFDCATKLAPLKAMTGCLVNSLLNSSGIVTGCEGDMVSTISSYILRLLSGRPTLVSDMAAFDDNDQSLLMWHCGSAPMELADNNSVTCRNVYRSEFAKGTDLEDLGPITSLTYKSGPVTVFRLTGEADSFYYFTGSMFEGKKSWYGNRGWVKDLKFYKEPIAVKDLINTILVNSIQHHYPMVLEDVGDYLEELSYWLDLKKVGKNTWERYLHD
jgi:L-fucose isomerase-like protein